jgi:hypothetical protein
MGMQAIVHRDSTRNVYYPSDSRRKSLGDHRSFRTGRERTEEENWKVDESRTAMVSYMAALALPGEG